MNGVGMGRLPKHTSDGHATFNLVKRLWGRYSESAHRASPPPRLLLMVLLSAQILFLAIVRLGPAAPLWSSGVLNETPSTSSVTVPLLMGRAGHVPSLNSMHQENEASPHTESKEFPSLPVSSLTSSLSSSSSVPSYAVNEDDQSLKQNPSKDLPSVSDNIIGHKLSLGGDHKAVSPKRKKPRKKKKTKGKMDVTATNGVVPLGGYSTGMGDQAQDESDKGLPFDDEQKIGDDFLGRMGKDSPSNQSVDDLLPSVSDELLSESVEIEDKGREDKAAVRGEASGEGNDGAQAMVASSIGVHDAASTSIDGAKRGYASVAESEWEAAPAEAEAHSELSVAEEGQKGEAEAERKSMAAEEREFMVAEATGATRSEDSLLEKAEEKAPAQKAGAGVSTIGLENEVEHQALGVKVKEPHIKQKVEEVSGSAECKYGYIYVYDLPPMFNRDVVANCSTLNPWVDVCPTLSNGGLGDSLGEASPLNQTGSWFESDQFTAEVVFHNRLLQHPCLTDKPEHASGFYVPYYAGLEVGQYLWRDHPAERRDWVGNQLLQWLGEQEAWKRSGGWDHFLMIGRITWDFRRSRDEDWGSGFFYHPSMQNMTRLLIERNPWDSKEMAVPYPTNFHPQGDSDLREWQDHIRSLSRSKLFSFAGARRGAFPNDFRGILLDQCDQARSCGSLDCSNHECNNNHKTLELFMDSAFCLQPRGDSFTRRSTFDCMLAGAIPVFFWHRSAYMQYKWHLPDDAGSYSVFISRDEVRNGTKIEDVLRALSTEMVQAMREAVIRLVPHIVYAASGFSLKGERDAFDVAMEGVMRRFHELGLNTHK